MFNVLVNSLPVFFEFIVENLIDDGDNMIALLGLLDTTGHVFGVVVHFVDELIVLVEFLVEDLDDFLFLFELVSQVVDFGLNVRLDHATDFFGRVEFTGFGLVLVRRTVIALRPHKLVRTQTGML